METISLGVRVGEVDATAFACVGRSVGWEGRMDADMLSSINCGDMSASLLAFALLLSATIPAEMAPTTITSPETTSSRDLAQTLIFRPPASTYPPKAHGSDDTGAESRCVSWLSVSSSFVSFVSDLQTAQIANVLVGAVIPGPVDDVVIVVSWSTLM